MFFAFMLCNFSVRMLKSIFFFAHKILKKPPQKVAYLWQLEVVFFLCSPDFPKQPRTSFPFYKFFDTTILCRISGSIYQASKCMKRAGWVDYAHHFATCPPHGFSDLPRALICSQPMRDKIVHIRMQYYKDGDD